MITLRQVEEFAQQAALLGVEGSRALLSSDWKYRLAAERAVELIGEAVTRLPPEVRDRQPTSLFTQSLELGNEAKPNAPASSVERPIGKRY